MDDCIALMLLASTSLVAGSAAQRQLAAVEEPTTKMSPLCDQLHGYARPGFDFRTTPTGRDIFPPSSNDQVYEDDYTKAMLSLLILVVAIPLVLVLLLYLWWCCRCICCRTSKGAQEERPSTRSFFALAFVVIFVVLIGTVHASTKLKDGADALPESIDGISGYLSNLETTAQLFKTNGDKMRACPALSSTEDPTGAITTAKNQFTSDVEQVHTVIMDTGLTKITQDLDGEGDNIADRMKMIIDASVAGTILLWLVVVLFAVAGLCKKRSRLYTTSKVLAFPIFILMTAILGVCLMTSVTMADFCVGDPRAFLTDELINQDSAGGQDFVNYYFNCKGESPFQNDWDAVQTSLTDLQNKLAGQGSSAAITCMSSQIAAGSANLVTLQGDLSCKLFSSFLGILIDRAVCTDFVEGLFYSWCLSSSASLLFWALFAALTGCERSLFLADDANIGGGPQVGGKPVSAGGLEGQLAMSAPAGGQNYNV